MKRVEQALEIILAQVQHNPKERIPLLEALGRVLAEEIYSDIDLPPFTNSAVDGFAVRATDIEKASTDTPVMLKVIGEVTAGEYPTQSLLPQTAMRVMTGAPLPIGADEIGRAHV